MKAMFPIVLFGVLVAATASAPGVAHPGGLNAQGCHNNRKTGDYHYHGSPRAQEPAPRVQARGGEVYFASCKEAKAAGRFNIRRGEPGYRAALDRDGDGVACEG